MNKPSISLRPEITRDDALMLMTWLADETVTRYLSDSRHVSRFIEQVLGRVQLPVLTHLFNQGGRFFMVCDPAQGPVGFVRLVMQGLRCEMVLVIGERCNWGRKLGAGALHEAIKLAFFELRADTLVAKIHPHNQRSLQAFQRAGFQLDCETPMLKSFVLTREQHRQVVQARAALHVASVESVESVAEAASASDITLTALDSARLKHLIAAARNPALARLAQEVERAIVVEPRQVGRGVVTMNSRALLRVDGQTREVALVYPQDDDGRADRLSVCSDIGTAILGYAEGDAIHWPVAGVQRHIQIGRLLYQPEAAGHFHL